MDTIQVSVEENETGFIAFAFSYPGAAVGVGTNQTGFPVCVTISVHRGVAPLQGAHSDPMTRLSSSTDIEITERVPATGEPLQCDSEGFFDADRRPFTDAHVDETHRLLDVSRDDILDFLDDFDDNRLEHRLEEDRRTIHAILDHIAITEHWYLTRVDSPGCPPRGLAILSNGHDRPAHHHP